MPFFFFLLYFCFLTLCYDSNSKFINCDGFAKTSQVLGSFMTKSINRHCVMGLIAIVADPWWYLKTLRKFRQKSSQIKWFLVVTSDVRAIPSPKLTRSSMWSLGLMVYQIYHIVLKNLNMVNHFYLTWQFQWYGLKRNAEDA